MLYFIISDTEMAVPRLRRSESMPASIGTRTALVPYEFHYIPIPCSVKLDRMREAARLDEEVDACERLLRYSDEDLS